MTPQQLETFVPPFAFVLGAMIGSFLNVVIYRLPREEEGLTLTHPKLSLCPHCKETIRGYDNIPLVSYLVLGGKCRKCKAPIPFRYFFVELFTAVLFAVIAARLFPGYAVMGVYAVLTAALIACTFIDIDLRIIPDKIDIPGMVIAPFVSALVPDLHRHGGGLGAAAFGDLARLGITIDEPRLAAVASSVLGIAVGSLSLLLVGFVGSKVFKKEAMGLGDVKLLGMIGGIIGWQGVLLAFLIACFAGAAIGIVVKLVTEDPYIPFGPFLSLGAFVIMLARKDVVWVLFTWYPSLIRGGGGG